MQQYKAKRNGSAPFRFAYGLRTKMKKMKKLSLAVSGYKKDVS